MNHSSERAQGNNIIDKIGISGSTLKLIAVITMLIDHIGAVIIEIGILGLNENRYSASQIMSTSSLMKWYELDSIFRSIGRIAFPIFCFLLLEGFLHTSNRKKYAARMILFAAISEIPFNLAFFNDALDVSHQNVFFTLSIALLVLIAIENYEDKKLFQFFIILAGCALADLLRTDYGSIGVLIVVILYFFRHDALKQTVVGSLSLLWEPMAIIAFLPIRLYNGKRGLNLKYIFYWFYPVHLLILYFINFLI